MEQVLDPVDADGMDVWFRHIAELFVREDEELRCARKMLQAAAMRSAAVGFGDIDGDSCPKPDHGSIESVENDEILVMTPRAGSKRLIAGEHLLLCIEAASGFDVGEVTVLGEWSRDDGPIHRSGVRLSLPRMLEHIQRREHHRLTVAFDLSPRATLEEGDPAVAVGSGEILDISECGARMRVRCVAPIAPNTKLLIRATFPAPFPSFILPVEVVHASVTAEAGRQIVGLRFLEQHPELGKAIHQLELRRAQRLRK